MSNPIKYCGNCGAQLPLTATFCMNCGARQLISSAAQSIPRAKRSWIRRLPGYQPGCRLWEGLLATAVYTMLILLFLSFVFPPLRAQPRQQVTPVAKATTQSAGISQASQSTPKPLPTVRGAEFVALAPVTTVVSTSTTIPTAIVIHPTATVTPISHSWDIPTIEDRKAEVGFGFFDYVVIKAISASRTQASDIITDVLNIDENLLVVTIQYKSASGSHIINTSNDFYIEGPRGKIQPVSPQALKIEDALTGTVENGKTVTGKVVFQVKQYESYDTLYYTPGKELKKIAITDPQPAPTPAPQLLTDLVNAAWQAEDWPEAIRLLELIQVHAPDSLDWKDKLYVAHFNYGNKLISAGNKTDAMSEYQKANMVDPSRGEAAIELTAIAPTPTPSYTDVERAEFLLYGRKLWDIAQRSDKYHRALIDAASKPGTSAVNVYTLARNSKNSQLNLSDQLYNVKVPKRAEPVKQALDTMLAGRFSVADNIMKALDSNKPSDLAKVRDDIEFDNDATMRFAAQFLMLAYELKVDWEKEVGGFDQGLTD